MDQTKSQQKQPMQFTRDDVARISASAINEVLEKLNAAHIVEGIAVFPAGEGVCLVDVVMRDLTANDWWTVLITVPPSQEELPDGTLTRGA